MRKMKKTVGIKGIAKPERLTDNEWGVLFEDMNHNLKFLAEGLQTLDRKIDGVNENLTARLDKFEKQTNDNFKTVFTFMDKTERNFKTVLEYLSKIDDEITDVKRELTEVKKLKIDETRVLSLERRVEFLESEISYLREHAVA